MTRSALSPRFVVDSEGQRRSVVLGMAEYKRLLRRLEDLEDALALDEARRAATGSSDYADIRAALHVAGRL